MSHPLESLDLDIDDDFYDKLETIEERVRAYTDADFEVLCETYHISENNRDRIEQLDSTVDKQEKELEKIKQRLSDSGEERRSMVSEDNQREKTDSTNSREQFPMYLSDELREDLDDRFEKFNARRRLDDLETIEKHKHFMEGLIRNGLEKDGLDKAVLAEANLSE